MREGVTYKRLGEVGTIIGGSTPKTDDPANWGGTNKWVTPAELDGSKYISKTQRMITDKATSKLQLLPTGTVLLSSRAPIGKVAITKSPMYCNQGFKNVVCGDSILNEYVYYCLIFNTPVLQKMGVGATFKEISKSMVEGFTIPVPSLSTQELIVRELDSISSVISAKKQQVLELDNLAQAIFLDTFGDPITNPKGWEMRELKENVEEMFLGPFGSSLKVSCYVDKEEAYCMVYEQKHAIKGRLDVETHYIDFDKYKELQRFTVKGGDFIMSCRGTIGKLYQLPYDAPLGIIHPSLMKIRIKEDRYSARFFQFLLVRIVANENTNGNSVQMAITAKELGTRRLILPPLSLQQAFAEKVQAIEEQKRLINQSIAEFESLLAQRMEFHFA